MKDKYTLGHYRTRMEHMVAVGHKVIRINEELRGTVEVATADENEVADETLEAPSRARPIGVSARVQERAQAEDQSIRKRNVLPVQRSFEMV